MDYIICQLPQADHLYLSLFYFSSFPATSEQTFAYVHVKESFSCCQKNKRELDLEKRKKETDIYTTTCRSFQQKWQIKFTIHKDDGNVKILSYSLSI